MGASLGGDDRIALVVDTTSNLAGLKAARTETQNYANDVKAVQSAASGTGAALEISAQQGREAWAAAGGDFNKFRDILAGVATQEKATGAAAAVAAGDVDVLATASANAATQGAKVAAVAAEQSTALSTMGVAADKAAAQQEFGSRAAVTAGKSYEAISPKARSAANAFAILSQVAITSNGSMAGVANAAGLAGQSIAAMADSARVAALASGIGALITVAATVIGALMALRTEAKATGAELEHITNINTAAAGDTALKQAQAVRDAAAADRDKKMTGDIRDFLPWSDSGKAQKAWEQAQAYVDALTAKTAQLHVTESTASEARERGYTKQFQDQVQTLLMQERMTAASNRSISDLDSQTATKHAQMTEDLEIQQRQTRESFNQYDAHNKLIALLPEEIAQRDEILRRQRDLNVAQQEALDRQVKIQKMEADNAALTRVRTAESDLDPNDITERVGAATQMYQDQQDAAVRAGQSETLAAQETNLKIRALRKQTAQEAMSNYAAITDAMLSSNNRAVKAVGMVADTIRRVMIGADGAHSAVLAIKEGAAAIGSAASGNFAAAALHAESALAYGKAAALALKESLGSGGSAGGGGSGGGGSNTTFEPSERQGSGNMTVVLNSVDPYSGAAVNTVAYELERGKVLNKPIVIPPTTGLMPAMG